MKKARNTMVLMIAAFVCLGSITADDAKSRSATIAEIKNMLQTLTGETRRLNETLANTRQETEFLAALEKWVTAVDSFKKKAKQLESRGKVKFLKTNAPPEEIKPELADFMAAMQTLAEGLQSKTDFLRENPKALKRAQRALTKLTDL